MPAHAWLNLLGFTPLVVAGTLIHLYPTVLGTRIPAGDTVPVLLCLTGDRLPGPGTVLRGLLDTGDFGSLWPEGVPERSVGTGALVAYGLAEWRSRGHWTTDSEWHLTIIGHLSAAIGWLAIGVGLAAWLTIVAGADPAGWSIEAPIAPLGLGCAVQAIVGSWTHLVPSIGPGDSTFALDSASSSPGRPASGLPHSRLRRWRYCSVWRWTSAG